MDRASHDSLWLEVRRVLDVESITRAYKDFAIAPGQLQEGEHPTAEPKRIHVSNLYEGNDGHLINHEPIVVAHELGHYFDFARDPDPSISRVERERRANDYMVELSGQHGRRAEALRERKQREADSDV
jgi:hypothetical protein